MRDDAESNCNLHEFGRCFDAELFHHAILMKRNRARLDLKNASNLLHRVAFRQELKHFPLPWAGYILFG